MKVLGMSFLRISRILWYLTLLFAFKGIQSGAVLIEGNTTTQPPSTASTTPQYSAQPPTTASTTPEYSTQPPTTASTTPEYSTQTPTTASTTPEYSTQPPTTASTTPEYSGCNLAPCIQQAGCGGFEQCLLEATSKRCNSYTIAFAAKEKYLDCLFGPEGFCSLKPFVQCYDNHLLKYTKASIPKSSQYRPEKLTRFIDGTISNPSSLLLPISPLNNHNCTIPRPVIVDMASCVGDAFATASMECTSVMPVARQTFFGIINPQLLKQNILNMFRVFITYHKQCFTPNFTPGGNTGVPGNLPLFEPFLLFATPNVGSIKGGTKVTIIGETASLSRIVIGRTVCPLQGRESNYIVCKTQSVPAAGSFKIVSRLYRGTENLVLAGNFTYGAEPKVTKVENLQTILSGGTDVVLQGENFESVQRPLMEIEALYKGGSWQFTSVCKVVSNTEIRCLVPPLINPHRVDPRTVPTVRPGDPNINFIGESRKKRSTAKKELQESPWPLYTTMWTEEQDIRHQHIKRRQKREVCHSEGRSVRGEPINDNQDLRYEVIFQLDGKTIQGSPSYTLDVYLDPILYQFEDHPTCKIFRQWALIKDTQIDIMGANLSYPLTCEDYKISIGGEDCEVQQIYEDRIICKPPEEEPETAPGDNSEQLNMWVAIGGTRLQFYVGCIEYENIILDNPTASYGLIAGLAALVLVILLISIFCCVSCRKKSNQKSREK